MNHEETLFAEALARTPGPSRARFLDGACGHDAALRARMEALLSAHEQAGSFLKRPPTGLGRGPAGLTKAIDPASAKPPPQGTVIGPYTLLRKLGEGGMGVVYLAEQTHPVRRRVALKLIRPGQDSRQIVARFEAERQALAMMDHPHIARVLDVGATDTGRPYFVMERVKGIPITDYCDRHRLTPRERLRLFAQVCQAVQHAHAKGIIHRDLKPGNVLVAEGDDGAPVPKVIDFGIAKAMGGRRLTDLTLCTRGAELVGTPLYMSPEQAGAGRANAADVDTRSDVYSLGVILYELLTGATPFDKQRLAEAAADEVRRIIREEDPPKPSTRLSALGATLSTVAASRHTEAKRLSQTIRGDLDWIVMRAMEKDRARRYATADALAREVERYLADEPVEAGPPSRVYRLRKFARRNRAALATTATVLLILLLATAVSAWQAVRANRASVDAHREADKQQAVNQFLNDMLAAGRDSLRTADNPASGPDVPVREVVDRAARMVDAGSLKDQPVVEAAVRRSLGHVYINMGRFGTAEHQFRTALRLYQQVYGPEHPDVADCMVQVAYAQARAGKGDGAARVVLAREGLAMHQRLLGDQNVRTAGSMRALCFVLEFSGNQQNIREAEQLSRRAIAIMQKLPPVQRPPLVLTLHDLERALLRQNRLAEAEETMRKAIEAQVQMGGADHPDLPGLQQEFGDLLVKRGKPREAEAAYREAVRIDPYDLGVRAPLDDLLRARHQDADADRLVDGLIVRLKRDPTHPVYGSDLGQWTNRLVKRHRLGDAEFVARLKISNLPRTGGSAATLAQAYDDLGWVLELEGRMAEAGEARRESLPFYPAALEEWRRTDAGTLAWHLFNYAARLLDAGRPAEAEAPLRESLMLTRKARGPEDPEVYRPLMWLCNCLVRLGKTGDEPAVWREQVEALRQRLAVVDSPGKRAAIYLALVTPLVESGQIAEAKNAYLKAVQLGLPPDLSPDEGASLNDLAWLLANAPDDASRDPVLAIEVARKALDTTGGHSANVWNTLGVAYYRAGDYETASKTLLQSLHVASENITFNDRAVQHLFTDPDLQSKAARASDMFFLAMSEWRLGNAEPAHRWYDEAVVWSDGIRPPDEGLLRERREAEAVFRTQRPATMPTTAPAIRPATRPATRPTPALQAVARPATRPTAQPAARPATRPAPRRAPLDPRIEMAANRAGELAAKFGPSDPRALGAINSLAFAYQAAGDYDDALRLFKQARDGFVKALGPDDADTLAVTWNLVYACDEAGRMQDAIAVLEPLRAHQATALNPADQRLLKTVSELGARYFATGRLAEAEPLLDSVSRAWLKQARFDSSIDCAAACERALGHGEKADELERVRYQAIADGLKRRLARPLPPDPQGRRGPPGFGDAIRVARPTRQDGGEPHRKPAAARRAKRSRRAGLHAVVPRPPGRLRSGQVAAPDGGARPRRGPGDVRHTRTARPRRAAGVVGREATAGSRCRRRRTESGGGRAQP